MAAGGVSGGTTRQCQARRELELTKNEQIEVKDTEYQRIIAPQR